MPNLKTCQQAQELICPFTLNRDHRHDGACIGDKCALWRWELDAEGNPTDKGYCGLAPKPSA